MLITGEIAKKKYVRRFPSFDAELDETVCNRTTNANLTLTMRIALRQINPQNGAAKGQANDSDNVPFSIARWKSGDWAVWKQKFQSSGQNFWSGKFWLINNHDVLQFRDRGVMYRHNVFCRFRLIVADASAAFQAHHTVDVVKLDHLEDKEYFRSADNLYAQTDILRSVIEKTSKNKPIYHRTHLHEIGHLLKLEHEATGSAVCPVNGNTNASACYGVTDKQKKAITGYGMVLMPHHAYPWRMAMSAMTGIGTVRSPTQNRQLAFAENLKAQLTHWSWKRPPLKNGTDLMSHDWVPVMRRQYPRRMPVPAGN